jgi:hypothetical protein
MPAIKLVRTPYILTPEEVLMFRRLLEAILRPLTQEDERKFWRHWNRIIKAPAHKLFGWETKEHRNPKFHSKFFVMLAVGYDAWEPEVARTKRVFEGQPIRKSFDDFREEVTILAGFYDVTYSVDGSLSRSAKSISFASMEQDEFELLYNAVAQVLLDYVLRRYTRDDLDRVVGVLEGFMEAPA